MQYIQFTSKVKISENKIFANKKTPMKHNINNIKQHTFLN